MMTRPTRPIIARRCLRNRWRAYDHWLRIWSSSPASTVESSRPAGASTTPVSMFCSYGATVSAMRSTCFGSVIPDARVEESVGEIGDKVEHDDRNRRDDQVAHDRVHVLLAEFLD